MNVASSCGRIKWFRLQLIDTGLQFIVVITCFMVRAVRVVTTTSCGIEIKVQYCFSATALKVYLLFFRRPQ